MGGIIFSWPGHPHKQSTVNEDYNCAFDIILRILVLLRGWKVKNLGEGKMGSIFCIDEKMTSRSIIYYCKDQESSDSQWTDSTATVV